MTPVVARREATRRSRATDPALHLLATVLGLSSEACVFEGYVVAEEGVGEGDDASSAGDEGDFCGFSGGAQVEVDLLEAGMGSHRDERGHVEG